MGQRSSQTRRSSQPTYVISPVTSLTHDSAILIYSSTSVYSIIHLFFPTSRNDVRLGQLFPYSFIFFIFIWLQEIFWCWRLIHQKRGIFEYVLIFYFLWYYFKGSGSIIYVQQQSNIDMRGVEHLFISICQL